MSPALAPPSEERRAIATEIQVAARHTAVYGLGNVSAKVLGFFMVPFYTHYLNPADYGVLEILDLSMSLFGMFLAVGMTAAMLRSYAAAESDGERRKVISTSFLFAAGAGILTFSLLVGVVRPVSLLLFGPAVPSKYLLISFSSFILGYIANVPRTYLRARDASGVFVMVDTAALLAMLVLNVFFIAVLRMGLLGILLSSFLVVSLQVVLLSAWMLRETGIAYGAALLRQMLTFGFPLIFSNMALFALNFSDRFFLQHLHSLAVVGIYAVGYKFGFMLNYLLVQPFMVMWQSRMYVIYKNPDHKDIFSQISLLYSLLLIYAGLALAVLSPEIVRLMVGEKFAASQDVIPVVTLAYIFYGVGYYAQLGMFLTGGTRLVGAVGLAAAGLNLFLNYFLILHFGMMGAAWSTLLSFMALTLGSYWLSQRVLPLHLGTTRIFVALAAGVCVYLLCRWCPLTSFTLTLLLKMAVLIAFPILLWKAILPKKEAATVVDAWEQLLAQISGFLRLPRRKALDI